MQIVVNIMQMMLLFGNFWNLKKNTFDLWLVEFVEMEPPEKEDESQLYLATAL